MDFRQEFQTLVRDGLLEYVRISDVHEAAAWHIFEQYADQDLSYTDCTSFAVMRDLDLVRAFTGDHHFSVLGFSVTP